MKDKRSHRRGAIGSQFFVIDSVSALKEYLRHRPESVHSIKCHPGTADKLRKDLEVYLSADITIDNTVAQGWLAELVLAPVLFEDFLAAVSDKKNDTILALDQVTDPRNLGAVVRSAAFFGIRHILIGENRQVGITQAAVATAMGGFALTDLVLVKNVGRALQQLKEHGYWIIGAAGDGMPLTELRSDYEKQVLVLGNEQKGLRSNIRAKSDVLVAIPAAPVGLDSLNVSVAAGIFIAYFSGVLRA